MQVLLSTLSLILLLSFAHPFYVSICEMNHNKKEETLEITVKIFSNDLETAIEQQTSKKLNLGLEEEHQETDAFLEAYVKKCLFIEVDGKTKELGYIGKEVEMDATWLYVEVKDVKTINTINVKNTFLLDYTNEQTNIVHLTVNNKKKSLSLNDKIESGELTF